MVFKTWCKIMDPQLWLVQFYFYCSSNFTVRRCCLRGPACNVVSVGISPSSSSSSSNNHQTIIKPPHPKCQIPIIEVYPQPPYVVGLWFSNFKVDIWILPSVREKVPVHRMLRNPSGVEKLTICSTRKATINTNQQLVCAIMACAKWTSHHSIMLESCLSPFPHAGEITLKGIPCPEIASTTGRGAIILDHPFKSPWRMLHPCGGSWPWNCWTTKRVRGCIGTIHFFPMKLKWIHDASKGQDLEEHVPFIHFSGSAG